MKINQLKSGVILTYLTLFLGTVISIIYTPLMLSILGQSEYGLYQLVASVVSYLSLLTFGFSGAYVRFYSRYKIINDENCVSKLNGMFFTVYSITAIIALICGLILSLNIEVIFENSLTIQEIEIARILMIILVINIALSFPFSLFNSYITANENFFFHRLLTLIKTISNPFLTLPILLLGYGSIGMVVITTFLNITIEIIYAIYCFKKLKIKFKFKGLDFSLLKEIAAFSSFIFLNIITDQINWSIDKFILGMVKGTTMVAVYSIAAQLNSYYLQFSTTISSVFIPKVHQIASSEKNNNKALTELFVKIGRIQFIIMSLILTELIFFGQPFIYFWAGAEYSQSYYVLLCLIIPVTVSLIQNIGIEIQRAKNLHKFRTLLYLAMALLNMIISIPLAIKFGALGSAIGTAISLIIANGLIMNIYYHFKVGLNIKYFWKEILSIMPAMLIPIIIGIFTLQFVKIDSIFTLAIAIILYAILYSAFILLLGANKSEKNMIKKPLNKLFRRI